MPNPRLNLLVRKNAGRRLLPVLKKKLASALNVLPSTVNFLPLEESDQIREQALCAFPPRYDLEREADNMRISASTSQMSRRLCRLSLMMTERSFSFFLKLTR